MSRQGRPKLPPRSQVILRIDQALLVETYALNPKLQDPTGGTRYGELTKLFTKLLIEHNNRIKLRIARKEEE